MQINPQVSHATDNSQSCFPARGQGFMDVGAVSPPLGEMGTGLDALPQCQDSNFLLKACNHPHFCELLKYLHCFTASLVPAGGSSRSGEVCRITAGCNADRHPPAEQQRRAVLLPAGGPVPGHCFLLGKKPTANQFCSHET